MELSKLGFLLITITVFTVGGAAAAVTAALQELRVRGRMRGTGETTEQRISRLTTSLSEAVHVIQEIESEIQERRKIADTLQSDIETYNRLKDLNQEEVEAVAQVLGVELRREGRRSFWTNFALNAAFFVLGVVVTVGSQYFFGI